MLRIFSNLHRLFKMMDEKIRNVMEAATLVHDYYNWINVYKSHDKDFIHTETGMSSHGLEFMLDALSFLSFNLEKKLREIAKEDQPKKPRKIIPISDYRRPK